MDTKSPSDLSYVTSLSSIVSLSDNLCCGLSPVVTGIPSLIQQWNGNSPFGFCTFPASSALQFWGLPFCTRGSSTQDKDEDEDADESLAANLADTVIEGDELPEIRVSRSVQGSRRNPVVESFFVSEEFSPDLKEDIHKWAK